MFVVLVGAMLATCTTSKDCSYNGACISSSCVCSPAWSGPRCETLRLLPARKDGGFRSPHSTPAEHTSSWGGSILYDEADGRWHMFAAEMANECGIDYWEPNSRVVHATAATADGPFAYASTVLEPFAHEPNAVRAPDGTWVIFLTLRHPSGDLYNCSADERPPRSRTAHDDPPPPRHTYMVHAPSPDGPWSTPQLVLKANTSIWDNRTVLIDTNLAVAILPDHSAVGIWRKCENPTGTVCEAQCCTFPHLLTASDWRDPSTYVPHAARIFPEVQPYGSEDPMLWLQPPPADHLDDDDAQDVASHEPRTRKPIVHAILHDEQGPERCTALGKHAFSNDLGATWTYAADFAYDGAVEWAAASGGGKTAVYRRERPHMIVDANGQPTHLSNGVQETTDTDRSWTLVQPLNSAPPSACTFRPTRLRTEALVNPLGVQTPSPRLGWALEALAEPPARNATQHAYRIEAFASSDASAASQLWDSGRVEGAQTLHVAYGGLPLRSSQRVYWRVTSWDAPGAATACAPSPLAWFETALLDEGAWHGAEWLARFAAKPDVSECELYEGSERNRAPRFRTDLEVPADAAGVRAYVAGLGYHRLFVDGQARAPLISPDLPPISA